MQIIIFLWVFTWYFMSMLKKSSLISCGLQASQRWPMLFCTIVIPSRSPILALWSSSRRLCELAIRSKSSSVWVREMREVAPDSSGDSHSDDRAPAGASPAWPLGCGRCWQCRFSMWLLVKSQRTVRRESSLGEPLPCLLEEKNMVNKMIQLNRQVVYCN